MVPLFENLMGQFSAVFVALLHFMMAFLLFLVLRRAWLAWITYVLLQLVLAGFALANLPNCLSLLSATELALWVVVMAIVLSRLGLLAGAFFFFSSRRRHTRFKCDWSSD